jgi:hypothetical protein
MRTPRELLMQQHYSAIPELDRLRQKVLASEWPELREPAKRPERNFIAAVVMKLWRELFSPCRQAWAGFAAVWVGLFVLHVATTDTAERRVRAASPAQLAETLEYRRRLLVSLFPPFDAAPAKPPHIMPPQARRQRTSRCELI